MAWVYGPILIGGMVDILLFGVMITQAYYYFTQFKRDRLWMKYLIGGLVVADTAHTVFEMAFLYRRLILFKENPVRLAESSWIFGTEPAMTAIIAFTVQAFYVWRVKVITGSIAMVFVILVCSVAELLGGLATAIACGIVVQFAAFHKFQSVVIVWLACSALADVLIAAVLVAHLRAHKSGYAPTDDIIMRIIRLTVSTGALTACCAMADLIAFLATTSNLHLMFNFPLAKFYIISLLSSLNSRRCDGSFADTTATAVITGPTFSTRITDIGGKARGGVSVLVTRSMQNDSERGMTMSSFDFEDAESREASAEMDIVQKDGYCAEV